jgi:acyl-CoA synthetase (AMP-forming)/AMP-acid ligase II
MLGYLGGPPGTGLAPGIDSDGWFTTGDVGVVHPDGWVTIQGRLKDVINRGGEKFAAGEIESVICSHPDIGSAAVLGVPDPRLGERVAAFVTVRAGHDWPGPDALVAYLDGQRLARQKLPVEWRVLAELPRTPTGKIRKNELLAGWDG